MAFKIAAVLLGSATDPCCCDDPPVDCCMYPWPNPLVSPLYPETDLPVSLQYKVDGGDPFFTMTKVAGQYRYEGSQEGNDWYIYAESTTVTDQWATNIVGSGSDDTPIGLCLVAGSGDLLVEDEFLDTYTFQVQEGGDPPRSFTITRITLCIWEGEDDAFPGCFGQVRYDPITFVWLGSYTCPNVGAAKDAPQSSPVGVYDTGVGVVITVT